MKKGIFNSLALRDYRPTAGGQARLFSLYESALRPYIEASLGWDRSFQLERFRRAYLPEATKIILADDAFAGYVVLKETEAALHVSLLLLTRKFRYRGIGSTIMKHIHEAAAAQRKQVTLSCFRNNDGALRFYLGLGYRIGHADDAFYDLYFAPAPADTEHPVHLSA